MSGFLNILQGKIEYESVKDAVKSGRAPMGIIGLSQVHKAHYISALCEELSKKALIICPDEGSAAKLCEDLNSISDKALQFVARDFSFRGADNKSHEFEQKRIGVLTRILEDDYSYIVCSVEAAVQLTLPSYELRKRTLKLKVGEEKSTHEIVNTLIAAGYVRTEQVEGVGQFALRGGILDLFAPGFSQPCRAEFWGDSIDSLSFFDVESQRRTEVIDEFSVTPSTEILFDSLDAMKERLTEFLPTVKGKGSVKAKESINEDIEALGHYIHVGAPDKYLSLAYRELHTIFDYTEDALLFVSESSSVKQKYNTVSALMNEDIKAMFTEGILTKGLDRYILSFSELLTQYEKRGAIFTDNLARGSFDVPVRELVSINARLLSRWDGTLSYLMEDMKPALERSYRIVVMAGTEKNSKELAFDLETEGIRAHYFPVVPAEFPKGSVSVISGSLSSGFEYDSHKFMLFSYGKAQRKSEQAPKRHFKKGKGITSLEEITKGDYVVHAVHGIGVFDGIRTMNVGGKIKDFIKVNFRGSDVLYVPVTQLDLIAKYISPKDTDKPVKLNRLGTDEWKKTRSRVKAAVRDMAQELTKLYSARLNSKGFAFSPDIDMQNDFERRFEFEETDDQLIAVNEIKSDMERSSPMDRLLCGDVGYGKTEIALRAAFKAVMDSKQVAVLAPTTVLVMQHFNTFSERMKKFPVKIACLSRFKTKKEQTEIIKKVKTGEIDIVIGTHRLLGKDIEFRDLGLLVVDEEQRFGVKHKERIKEIRNNVDVLTLSATPIPRTLHMSMINIKDMSVLTEPPENRFPVRTVVLEHNDAVICDAIKRELSRGGQVYYIHNRISSIDAVARRLQKVFPDANISVAHGAMEEEPLEEIMMEMLEGKINILVCTTIIETGLDISNVNTIIIEDADRFGLSQLYQLKGRVGRTNRRAFAYLTYRRDKILNENATKRLKAIKEFTEFGSGFKIAMRDLEIRGAGNILGAEQHGHMETVGYDMYCELLAQSVSEITGDSPKEEKQAVIDVNVEGYIPPSYIKNHSMRLDIYKKIAAIQNEAEKLEVESEICDRFGDVPKSVSSLISIAEIKYMAEDCGISEVSYKDGKILCYFNGEFSLAAIAELVALYGNKFMVSAGAKPYMVLKTKETDGDKLLLKIKKLLKEYNKLLHKDAN